MEGSNRVAIDMEHFLDPNPVLAASFFRPKTP